MILSFFPYSSTHCLVQDGCYNYLEKKERKKGKKKGESGTSLVVQWIRIRLPMQGTWVRTLAWVDSTCLGAGSRGLEAQLPSLHAATTEAPTPRAPSLQPNERPEHCSEEEPQLSAPRQSPCRSNEGPVQPKRKIIT